MLIPTNWQYNTIIGTANVLILYNYEEHAKATKLGSFNLFVLYSSSNMRALLFPFISSMKLLENLLLFGFLCENYLC